MGRICKAKLIPKSFHLRPSEDWNIDVFDQILFATVVQFNGRPYAPVAAFLVVVLFLWSRFWRGSRLWQLNKAVGIAIGFFFACYAFQVAAYTFVFTKFEASKAASFSRYMAPAGLMVFVALGMLSMRGYIDWSRSRRMVVSWGLFTLGVLIIFSASTKIVPEQRADPRLKHIASVIREIYPAGDNLTLIDAKGNGFALPLSVSTSMVICLRITEHFIQTPISL